ncbi:DNA repair protein RAD51 homolog 4 [Lucilia cuprina]|uniref:DNA repair protein RAD51 homolog 4 n=1 Tax=Lucilia cuprina TaxID=7375 RepID=UPI001F061A0E|nr:DNA repair protein RAD51 homolog 4 [Lucilia cuprina]
MFKLHSLPNTELSDYCLNILEKHGIIRVREFIHEKPEKLMKILNLNLEQVLKIKKEFRALYGPKRIIVEPPEQETQDEEENLVHEIRIYDPKKKVYGSHINALDNMLAPCLLLNNCSFWEICGPTGVGKTQLALTLILNFVINQVAPALYIDTKLDFSASRIKDMLKAREIEPELYAGIMSYIKVERVLSAQGVVEMLAELHKQIELGNLDASAIKLIVIDSLPAVWFLLKAESNRLAGKWLLSRLSQNINRLVRQHYISVICINLSLLPSTPEENETKPTTSLAAALNDQDISDIIAADDMELVNDKTSSLSSSDYRPVLGLCWLTKPHLRLSLEFPPSDDVSYKLDPSLRIIKLIKSTWSPSDLSCSVSLQPEGVI